MIKRRYLGYAALLLGFLCALAWALSRPAPTRQAPVRLTGFTSGNVGPLGKRFSRKSAAAIRTSLKWFADGTNAAVFEISNPKRFSIYLANVGRFQTKGESPLDEEVPLLTQAALTIIKPGESVKTEVAVLPHKDPWRIEFTYFQAEAGFLRRGLDWAREQVAGAPLQTESCSLPSEWLPP